MPYTASFTLCSRYNFKTLTSVSPWAPGSAITAASVEEKAYKGFKVLMLSCYCHIFFFRSVEISDSSSTEDVEVTLLRQTLSFCRFSLARALRGAPLGSSLFRSSALTESLAPAKQNTETK